MFKQRERKKKYLLDRDRDRERLLFFSLERDLYLRLSLETDLSGGQKLNITNQLSSTISNKYQKNLFIPAATAADTPPPR